MYYLPFDVPPWVPQWAHNIIETVSQWTDHPFVGLIMVGLTIWAILGIYWRTLRPLGRYRKATFYTTLFLTVALNTPLTTPTWGTPFEFFVGMFFASLMLENRESSRRQLINFVVAIISPLVVYGALLYFHISTFEFGVIATFAIGMLFSKLMPRAHHPTQEVT